MDLFAQHTILTVSRLTTLIKDLLEDNFSQVWVEGEISNRSLPSSGHLYFSLKDSGAALRCVMFRSSFKALKFNLEEGMAVVLRGHLSVYDQRGDYQLIVEYAEPKGLGALQAAFLQLKERLDREGLFKSERKRPIPRLPRTVGIITSATGAVIRDISTVLKRRHAGVHLLLYPVRVQGVGAAEEIARAIDEMNRLQAADVLIVGRGGGSLEDLWAFNDETVARAVQRSTIPIISAVGHETDWSICDFVADMRAATPSAAAELVSTAKEELFQQVQLLQHRLNHSIIGRLHLEKTFFEGLSRALRDPSRIVEHHAQRVDDLAERLERRMQYQLERYRERINEKRQMLAAHHPQQQLERLRQALLLLSERAERQICGRLDHLGKLRLTATARLDALSPLQTLLRGFSVAERLSDGKIVSKADEIHCGEELRLRFAQGSALCLVEETYNDSGGKATT